jgi:hypothetical protein
VGDSRSGTRAESTTAAASAGLSRRGWILFAACTAVVAVILLAAGVLLTGIPAGNAAGHGSSNQADWVPTPNLDPGPTPLGLPPRPTPTEVATVPAQPVASLTTGDCLQTYPSLWADAYPVVNCAEPHIAQLLSRGTLPEPAGAPFPGTDAVAAQATDLCTAPGLLNWDWVAVWNEDAQTDVRYPNTAAQWAAGSRSYYCFVYTFSRHELTGSAVAAH